MFCLRHPDCQFDLERGPRIRPREPQLGSFDRPDQVQEDLVVWKTARRPSPRPREPLFRTATRRRVDWALHLSAYENIANPHAIEI